MEEYFDVYKPTSEASGLIKPKSEVHKNGYWHKSFHCWIIYTDSKGEDYILLQQRDPFVKSWPGKFDTSAAGHYMAGEGIEGGLRELKEELGIMVTEADLIPLGLRVCVNEFDPASLNYEFQDVYFLVDRRSLLDYSMALGEVAGLVAVPVQEGIALFTDELEKISAPGLRLNPNGAVEPTIFDIIKTDFVPSLDNFYLKIMILAERALRGEKHLYI
ncbi:NUDIX hydrolase [Spirosoma endophyticum]|uniref:NUDIX domain-containing protein n=1 Tax=Spirosoma endophyticum TaxID=662367 RepID=A0A1I2H2A6_9BACT|nr:NUDIX domain-containing protein [Spirosoma endophyticum]SFF23530.1 NUDIX domain-containing protein [Spirosoma endophyticum]